MNISGIIQIVSSGLDSVRHALSPIAGILLSATCSRRPGFSAIITSAKIYADMYQSENDDVVKRFVYNVVEKIRQNIHDDGICFVIIPPGELKLQLAGANGGGPVLLDGNNTNFVFTYAIIR